MVTDDYYTVATPLYFLPAGAVTGKLAVKA